MDAPTRIDETVPIAEGVEMPWLGLGTWRMRGDDGEVETAVAAALEAGYRSIDTAAVYGNEEAVGRAIRDSGVPREQIFVTTKLWNDAHGYRPALRALEASLERLGLTYVDLYLIHWPVEGRFLETWRALELLHAEGRSRAIGVSNFLGHHLELLLENTERRPAVNQIEFHPRLVQPALLRFCHGHGIRPEAWSPLMKGRIGEIPELRAIAEAHGKTPAQIALRWNIQRGVVTIPKSRSPERIRENAGLFDFSLSPEELERIDALDRNDRIGPHPDDFA